MNRLIVLDTNPLRARIENGRIIKIMNANFGIFDFYFSLEAMPEAPRSETLVAGLRSVLAILQPEKGLHAGNSTDAQSSCMRRVARRLTQVTRHDRGIASRPCNAAGLSDIEPAVLAALMKERERELHPSTAPFCFTREGGRRRLRLRRIRRPRPG